MVGIYKWTSPSGKIYIGQAINLKKREREFKRPNSPYTSIGSAIDNARAKYNDFNKWKYEVLEKCTVEELDEKETYWIDFYDSKNNGYNSTYGGDGNKGWKPSKEQTEHLQYCQSIARENGCYDAWYSSDTLKQLTSERFKGRTWTEEQKQKISNSLKGNKLSKETCEKMRVAMKKKFEDGWVNTNQKKAVSKKVEEYSLDGVLLATYSSIKDATLSKGGKKGDKRIRMVIQGKKDSAFNSFWKIAS